MRILRRLFGAQSPAFGDDPGQWEGLSGYDKVQQAIRSNDQQMLGAIASSSNNSQWRYMAIERLDDRKVLRALATKDKDIFARAKASVRLQSEADRREAASAMAQWCQPKILKKLQRLSMETGKPAFSGGLLASARGDYRALWTWIEERIRTQGAYGLADLAITFENNLAQIDSDRNGRRCFTTWLKKTASPHNAQSDHHYTVTVERLWVLRTGDDVYEWAVEEHNFQAST